MFRHYDGELFERIREIALGKMATPFRGPSALYRTAGERPPALGETILRTPQLAKSVNDGGATGPAGAAPIQEPTPAPPRPALHKLRMGERLVLLGIRECLPQYLTAKIAANFPEHEVYTRQGDDTPKLTDEEVRRYRFFAGYFTKHGVDAVPGPKRVITVLREPRERILALYHRWRAMRPDIIERYDLRAARMAHALPLKDFLRSSRPEVIAATNNHLVRVLLGPLRINMSEGFRLEDHHYAAETALMNLQRFNYVAFFDTLGADIDAMFPMVGLAEPRGAPVPDPLDVLIRDPDNFERIEEQQPDEETWALLDGITDLDRLLYKRAQDLKHTLRNPYPS